MPSSDVSFEPSICGTNYSVPNEAGPPILVMITFRLSGNSSDCYSIGPCAKLLHDLKYHARLVTFFNKV